MNIKICWDIKDGFKGSAYIFWCAVLKNNHELSFSIKGSKCLDQMGCYLLLRLHSIAWVYLYSRHKIAVLETMFAKMNYIFLNFQIFFRYNSG